METKKLGRPRIHPPKDPAQKRKVGRPKAPKSYMEETSVWQVRLRKSLMARLMDYIKKEKRKKKNKIYANGIITSLIEGFLQEQENGKVIEEIQEEATADGKILETC